jgi:hypothetical protein
MYSRPQKLLKAYSIICKFISNVVKVDFCFPLKVLSSLLLSRERALLTIIFHSSRKWLISILLIGKIISIDIH